MWLNPQETDLVTFTEKILNGKLHFCTVELVQFVQVKYSEVVGGICFLTNAFLKIYSKLARKTHTMSVSFFLIKLQAFSRKFYEIFRKIFFVGHLRWLLLSILFYVSILPSDKHFYKLSQLLLRIPKSLFASKAFNRGHNAIQYWGRVKQNEVYRVTKILRCGQVQSSTCKWNLHTYCELY